MQLTKYILKRKNKYTLSETEMLLSEVHSISILVKIVVVKLRVISQFS